MVYLIWFYVADEFKVDNIFILISTNIQPCNRPKPAGEGKVRQNSRYLCFTVYYNRIPIAEGIDLAPESVEAIGTEIAGVIAKSC
jgi:hypothetical protein